MEKVIIFSPHLDDDAIGCGGILQKLKKYYVQVVFFTRDQRAKNLDKVYRDFDNVDFKWFGEKNYVDISKDDIVKMAELISEGSSIVFLPYEHDKHPDHREVSLAVQEAIQYTKHLFYFKNPDISALQYEVWTPLLTPNFYTEIDSFLEQKRYMINAYFDGLKNDFDWVDMIFALNKYRAYSETNSKYNYVEAFYEL